MISQSVKDTLKAEGLTEILKISDDDDLIYGTNIRIRMETENMGNVELYMFNQCYMAKAYINGPERCFMEDFKVSNKKFSFAQLRENIQEVSNSLEQILNVFHVLFSVVPI